MKKLASLASSSRSGGKIRKRIRGAALVEYAVLLVAICIGAGYAFKGLGKEVTRGTVESTTVVKSAGR